MTYGDTPREMAKLRTQIRVLRKRRAETHGEILRLQRRYDKLKRLTQSRPTRHDFIKTREGGIESARTLYLSYKRWARATQARPQRRWRSL